MGDVEMLENGTRRLPDRNVSRVHRELGLSMPYGMGSFHGERFARSLVLPTDSDRQGEHCWLVELQGLGSDALILSLAIVGDLILGVSEPGQPVPDIDLGIFHGREKGVCFQHLAIRPTRSDLYLIDLHSATGTQLNSVPVRPGIEVKLLGNDAIVMGGFGFMLRVFETPETLALSAPRSSASQNIDAARTSLLDTGRLPK